RAAGADRWSSRSAAEIRRPLLLFERPTRRGYGIRWGSLHALAATARSRLLNSVSYRVAFNPATPGVAAGVTPIECMRPCIVDHLTPARGRRWWTSVAAAHVFDAIRRVHARVPFLISRRPKTRGRSVPRPEC